MSEKITYDQENCTGTIKIEAKGFSIKRTFKVDKAHAHIFSYVEKAMCDERHKIKLALAANDLATGYTKLIDDVSTWLTPMPDMMVSRNKNEKQVWKIIEENYEPLNDARFKEDCPLHVLENLKKQIKGL